MTDNRGESPLGQQVSAALREVEEEDLAAAMRRQAMDSQEARFDRQGQELSDLTTRFEELMFKVDKIETKLLQVNNFEKRIDGMEEGNARVQEKVKRKLEEFELVHQSQNSRVKEVVEDCKDVLVVAERFKTIAERLEDSMDAMKSDFSDKMATSHTQQSKKINLAQYELESHRGELARLGGHVEALLAGAKQHNQDYVELELKLDQCDGTVTRLQNETLKRKEYKLTHTVLESEVKGHFQLLDLLKKQIHATDIYLDRYLPVATLNMIKDAHEECLSRPKDRKSFLTRLDQTFKEFQDRIQVVEEKDELSRDVLLHQCDLDKRYYHIPAIVIPPTISSDEEADSDEIDSGSDGADSPASGQQRDSHKPRRDDPVGRRQHRYRGVEGDGDVDVDDAEAEDESEDGDEAAGPRGRGEDSGEEENDDDDDDDDQTSQQKKKKSKRSKVSADWEHRSLGLGPKEYRKLYGGRRAAGELEEEEEEEEEADQQTGMPNEGNEDGEPEGSEMEGGSTDSQRSHGGPGRRPRSQKPRKDAKPKILDFDDVYKSEKAKKATEKQIRMQEEFNSFRDQEEEERSELEIQPTSQVAEDDDGVADRPAERVPIEPIEKAQKEEVPKQQLEPAVKKSPRKKREQEPAKRPELLVPSPEKVATRTPLKAPAQIEAPFAPLPPSTGSFFRGLVPREEALFVEGDPEMAGMVGRAGPAQEALRQRVRERQMQGSAFIPKFALSGEAGELSQAQSMLARPKKKEPEQKKVDEAGQESEDQPTDQQPTDQSQNEEANADHQEEAGTVLSTEPQMSQENAIPTSKSEANDHSSSAPTSSKQEMQSQSQSYAVTSSDNKFEGGKDSDKTGSSRQREPKPPGHRASSQASNTNARASQEPAQKNIKDPQQPSKKTVTIIESKEDDVREIDGGGGQVQVPRAAQEAPQQKSILKSGKKQSETKKVKFEKASTLLVTDTTEKEKTEKGPTEKQKAKPELAKGANSQSSVSPTPARKAEVAKKSSEKEATGSTSKKSSSKAAAQASVAPQKKKKSTRELAGPSTDSIEKMLTEHPVIMEVKAKMDIFNKKFDKEIKDAQKVERDHHQKLLNEIQALRKALGEEREATTRDFGRLDEDLSQQIKSTADHLRGMVQGWNKQNQEYFEQQVGNLHSKILQVKSDNILMNDRNMKAIGLDHPSLSSKTTIFALNKVVEMILQFLVTEQLLDRGRGGEGEQVSGSYLPAQRTVKFGDRFHKSSSAKGPINERSGHEIIPQLDLEHAMSPTENTGSGKSTQRGILDTPNREHTQPDSDSKRASSNRFPPHSGSPVFFQYKRLQQQGVEILESAWLLHQEMNIVADQVETNTVKQLKQLFKNNQVDEMQKKMKALRSKWLQSDQDASLSIKAMLLYDELVKHDNKLPEQNIVTSLVNQNMWNLLKFPQDKIFQIQTDYIRGEKELVGPNASSCRMDTHGQSSNESRYAHAQQPSQIMETFDRLLSPLSMTGGYGALPIPRPYTQFQETDRSGMNQSAFSDVHQQQPLLIQRKDRNPVVHVQQKQRQLQKLTEMTLNMRSLKKDPQHSEQHSSLAPSTQHCFEVKQLAATDRDLADSSPPSQWMPPAQESILRRTVLTPQSQLLSRQDWRRGSAPRDKILRGSYQPSPTDRRKLVPVFMPRTSQAPSPLAQSLRQDGRDAVQFHPYDTHTGRTGTTGPTPRLTSKGIATAAVISSVRDSRQLSQSGAQRHSTTPSAHSMNERALNRQIHLHQRNAMKEHVHCQPGHTQTERDDAIKKKVFTFPEVGGSNPSRRRSNYKNV